jgi:hypothetical protein
MKPNWVAIDRHSLTASATSFIIQALLLWNVSASPALSIKFYFRKIFFAWSGLTNMRVQFFVFYRNKVIASQIRDHTNGYHIDYGAVY